MVFIPAPGVAQFNMIFATPGGTAENIFHVAHIDSSSWTNVQLNAMATIIGNWEQTIGRLRRVSAVINTNILCRDLSSHTGAETTFSGEGPGTLAGAALPSNVTLAIKKVSGLAGRSNRGRVYHIGLSEAKATNDTYDGTECTALLTAYNGLITAVDAVANCDLVILKSQENKVKLNPRTWIGVSTFALTDGTLDSQRRRLLGHNIHR